MSTYQYYDTGGNLQTVEADNPNAALSGASNIDPHSGVQLINSAPAAPTSNYNPNVSTTTVSNSNKIDQVPGMVTDLNNLSNKGLSTNDTGTTQYADGSIYQNYDEGTTPLQEVDTSAEDQQTNDLLDQMKASLDASTKSLIDNIQQKFALRKQEQADINMRQTKAVNNALLMGGATGKGSSSQYAPISSSGIVSAQESYGIKQLADLDAQENDLIAQAKAAQDSGNYQLMEKQLELIDKKRQEKIDAATKLNEQIAEQNAKIREQNIQVSKDNAVADQYANGVTDIPTIVENLTNSGLQITTKEVADTLKNLIPPGLDDLVKTLQNNGAPQEVLQKVLASGNMSEAYKNAGSYAAGGTGIVGEYNFYKAQAEAAGQIPVDFQTYQNIDANRKKSIAAAGAPAGSGYSNTIVTKIQGIANQFDNEQVVKDFNTASTQVDFIKDLGNKPTDDIARVYAFAKVMDPNSVVREGEYKTVQDYAQAVLQNAGLKTKRVFTNSGFLTDEARNYMNSTLQARLKTQEKTYKNIYNEYGRRINKISGGTDGVEFLTDYSKGYNGYSTSSDLVQLGEIAKQAINAVYADADDSVIQGIDELYLQGYGDLDVYEYLKSKGLAK